MKQRIALVAVTALTAGVLSVASAPVANAAAGDVTLGTGSTNVLTAFAETAAGVSGTATISAGGVLALDIAAQTATAGNDFTFASITGGTFTAINTGGAIAVGALSATSTDAAILNDLVATPTAAGTNMVILVKIDDANGALQYTVTVTVSDQRAIGETSGVAHISGSICGATNLIGTAPLSGRAGISSDVSPFESGSAAGRIITVPVGGLLTVNYQTSDVFTLSGPLSIQSLDPAATGAAASSLTNGKVVVTGRAAIDSFTLSASAVGAATIVVDPTVADQTATAANTIRVTVVASCSSSGFVAAASFVSVEATSVIATDNVDASASKADTEQGFLSIVGNSAYGTVLPSGTHTTAL
jgi:hypothetical protein